MLPAADTITPQAYKRFMQVKGQPDLVIKANDTLSVP